MLAIVSSYKKEQAPDTSIYDRLVDIIACCQDEKQDSLLKALKPFLTANRISSAINAQKYIEDIKKLYQANPNNKNDSISNQYKLEEQMILDGIKHESRQQNIKPETEITNTLVEEIKPNTEEKDNFITLLKEHIEPYEDEYFEDQTRVRYSNGNLLISAEKNGANTLSAFISTPRGNCSNGQNIRFVAGVSHGSTPEKLSELYTARFKEFELSKNQQQQFLKLGKTGIKISFNSFLLCSIYFLPNASDTDLDTYCFNYSENRLDMPTNDELNNQIQVLINDNYAVNMFKDCLYYKTKQYWSSSNGGNSIHGLTIDNLIHYGLIKIEADQTGKKIFDDLLTIILPKVR
jgi:hypothetical protein